MTANEIRYMYLQYFKEKGHKVIPSASLVPENDPTVLFTTAGMHPLVPYLLGEKHPEGNRLANIQKCVRTGDIDEVGDDTHLTFFEMLGNWSLGDYWKEEAITFTYELFTKEFGIDPKNIAITCFAGEEGIPKDEESAKIWQSLGIPSERIAFLGREDNFWGPAGETGPCGPDTEIFIWVGDDPAPQKFESEDKRWVEMGNDVFMEYFKRYSSKLSAKGLKKVKGPGKWFFDLDSQGNPAIWRHENQQFEDVQLQIKEDVEPEYIKLEHKNVDFGGGLERIVAYLEGKSNVYETELFGPILTEIERLSGKKYEDNKQSFRIVADHIKAAVFILDDGALPSNKDRGYVLRRIIRRAIVKAHQIGISENFTTKITKKIFEIYKDIYFNSDKTVISSHSEPTGGWTEEGEKSHHVQGDSSAEPQNDKEKTILAELEKEENKFRRTLKDGLRILANQKGITGRVLFDLYQSYGLPLEISVEEAKNQGININNETIEQYNNLMLQHQELSRTASAGMFKGGLAEAGEITTKYHTATHLLLAALRQVLGDHVLQRGSNITAERIRFDFSHPEKMTLEQIAEVENIVNKNIEADFPVEMKQMSLEDAKNKGAMGVFDAKYGDKVKVYSIGNISKEICGGPHVSHTGELGKFKIVKEEASSAWVRRIKAVLG